MGGRGYMRMGNRKMDRVPSLAVGAEWSMVEEFDLPALLKLVANPPQVEDLVWTGHLDQYDEAYDKLTTRSAKPLKRIENKVFYAVRTADDPILEKFAVEEIGNVYATDAILALLMASPRSVYSWDITIEKTNGILFLDKRENSLFDFLTVSETAREPPQATEDIDEINHPEKLSIEATMINQNFSQQVLKENDPASRKTVSSNATYFIWPLVCTSSHNKTFLTLSSPSPLLKQFEPNPFFEDDNSGGEPASVAYRYRKFTLGGINVIARCELHGWTSKRGEDQNITVYSLNEWDSKYADGVNWRQKIDQQSGAVLATELKNNSCKLAKWTAQSILAGADQMKLGYVSRVANTNAYEHTILATQFFKPKELAAQINLNINNMWGIVKMLCELVLNKQDGKYVLLKDPNKATVRLYSVPLTFDEDEDEEGDADEDEHDEEDDDA
jgi:translation initiation factor 3 subunit D